jgi:phosphoglycerate dehydrogenase-like enzyme
VVVCLPLTDETVGVVNAAAFSAMKPTAYLVGLGRGDQVDEAALADALRNKKIAGAVLDVFSQEPLPPEHPLWDVEGLVITPHIAGDTLDYKGLVADLFAKNLQCYLDGTPLMNLVDLSKGY